MTYNDVQELHNIQPVANLASVLERGILCHNDARSMEHVSVAMNEVQERRERTRVPGGLQLHAYANLYFHARNPMLFKRNAQHADLCVLSIRKEVLLLPDVVIADGNAASPIVRFEPSPGGLSLLDADLVFSQDWRHPDPLEKRRRGIRKGAEALVPGVVSPRYIRGVYVSCDATHEAVQAAFPTLKIKVSPSLFFQS